MKLAKEEVKIRGEKRKIPRKPPRPQPFRALGLLTQKVSFLQQTSSLNRINLSQFRRQDPSQEMEVLKQMLRPPSH